VDLIALLFGFFEARGQYDAAACCVRFHRMGECSCVGKLKVACSISMT